MAFKFPVLFTLRLVALPASLLAIDAPPAPSRYKIVGFGDSLMAGYGLDAGQSFPGKA